MNTDVQQPVEHVRQENDALFFERLSHKLGGSAHTTTIFGEPVERHGVTVVPVAKAQWGFKGDNGFDRDGANANNSGGGGISMTPVGYIELKEGHARYHPVYDPSLILPLLLGLGFVTALTLRGVRLLVRS